MPRTATAPSTTAPLPGEQGLASGFLLGLLLGGEPRAPGLPAGTGRRIGAEVDDAVGRAHHVEVVLDDKDPVPPLGQAPERLHEHGVAVEETDRGGDITYHGPGQLVGYAILDLRARGPVDLHAYLRSIEAALIDAAARPADWIMSAIVGAAGLAPGWFSFNVADGRCETCAGQGRLRVEMSFLPDVDIDCEVCRGRRFGEETLQVTYRGKSIADVLDMSAENVFELFSAYPKLSRILKTLVDVGLGYLPENSGEPGLG